MEVYPIHHRNRVFRIITEYDLTFVEVRGILDYLLEAGEFPQNGEEPGEARLYDFKLGSVEYSVDVQSYEIVVYRRTET